MLRRTWPTNSIPPPSTCCGCCGGGRGDRVEPGPPVRSSVLVFGGPRTVGELAAAEQVRSPTISRLVAEMEADGLVSRSPVVADRRAVAVAATEKGSRVLHAARRRRVAALAARVASLPVEDQAGSRSAAAVMEGPCLRSYQSLIERPFGTTLPEVQQHNCHTPSVG